MVTFWIEEIGIFDDENKLKKQFLEADKTKPTIESPKNPNNMYISKPINIREISDRLESYEIPDDL